MTKEERIDAFNEKHWDWLTVTLIDSNELILDGKFTFKACEINNLMELLTEAKEIMEAE